MKWKVLPQKSDDLIEQLLINRNLKSKKDQEDFFNPKIADYQDILNIDNIDIAKKRILKAVKNQELIFVSGDFDVDGICGAAILYLGLGAIGAKVLPYIPHREKEGYGLSEMGLNYAKEQGAKLVISVDCGIVDFEQAQMAAALGLDLIITDHHQPIKNKRPKALTIVHSTKMCGSAVAWCLVKSLSKDNQENDLLDLVAIATVADMMPMQKINRAFVFEGLKILNNTKRVGLLALIKECGITLDNIGSFEIGHMLAPRLNAAGRLDSAMDALRLICTKNLQKAYDLAKKLGTTNDQRKKLTTDAIEIAKLQITEQKKIYILSDESWNPGIIGLVAGRISESTQRPAIAIAKGLEQSKGSARSIDGINIVEIIRECSDLLIAVGGHPGAAGFTIPTQHIPVFRERMEVLLENTVIDEAVLKIDASVNSKTLSMDLAQKIARFDPFGVDNTKPILASFGTRITDIKTVGNGKHLKGKLDNINFIAFNMGDMAQILQDNMLLDIAFHLEINQFNGTKSLQLLVKDLKIA